MVKFFLTLSAIALAAAAAISGQASAATVTDQYKVTSAVGSGADHSVWISTGLGAGVGSDFDFDPAGLLTLFSDLTATLTGRAVSQNNAAAWFHVAFNFDDTFLQAPSFKSENGSVATADTFYRDLQGGTLTGGGILAGLDLSVSRKPANGEYAAQIGSGTATNNGANNKNNNFGMAVWFTITVENATCEICDGNSIIANLDGKQGDVNVDLSPVPLPASALMLAGGLGVLGGMRRRKRRAA